MDTVKKFHTGFLLFFVFFAYPHNFILASTVETFSIKTARTSLKSFMISIQPQKGWKIRSPKGADDEFSGGHLEISAKTTTKKEPIKLNIQWPRHQIEDKKEKFYGYDKFFEIFCTLDADFDSSFYLVIKGSACSINECTPFRKIIYVPNYNTKFLDLESNILVLIFFSFLGGLLLNVMPCVLPVLSLKIFGTFHQMKNAERSIKTNISFSFSGIITSFFVLGILATLFKDAGLSLGWGIHFQNGWFVGCMAILTGLLGLNFLGALKLILPGSIQNFLDSLIRRQNGERIASFLSGAFATLLATPCTAPFLGTALGYGISRSTGEILLLFMFMGMGFGFPYLLLLILPEKAMRNIVSALNFKGLRVLIGASILGTSIWLSYIFFTYHFELIVSKHRLKAEINEDIFKKINLAIQSGRVVVVNVTAAWCLTCKLNEERALKPLKQLLSEHSDIPCDLITLDWTQTSTEIGSFLKMYNRIGIPFTIIFSSYYPDGKVISEIYSLKEIKAALREAGLRI